MTTIERENNLLTTDGYFAEFYYLCGEYPDSNYSDIWKQLEEQMFVKFGINEFDNYAAFRQAKSRYHKR